MSAADEFPVCPWCGGDGCQSCAYTGRGDTHPDDCNCIEHACAQCYTTFRPDDPAPVETTHGRVHAECHDDARRTFGAVR